MLRASDIFEGSSLDRVGARSQAGLLSCARQRLPQRGGAGRAPVSSPPLKGSYPHGSARSLFECSSRLQAALGDSGQLQEEFGKYIESVLQSPLWSETYVEGVRVPWRQAGAAAKTPPMLVALDCPGLYLFSSAAGVPRYWGQAGWDTEQTLWDRLRSRYMGGPKSQFQLAAKYERDLVARGLDGYPSDIRVWSVDQDKDLRLRHAVDLAHHGASGFWFTVLPVRERELISTIERRVIDVANTWNERHGYPQLLNER